MPAATLGAAERDLCFAVLKIAFVEQGLAAGKSIAILDDALALLPEGSRRALARVLKQLARGRQIVHGSTDVAFREAADHAG
jgi:energy-coupling factor transporter ATP-binding protein EcfA2